MANLEREMLNPDPFVQFERWFEQARSDNVQEPEAMALSTCGTGGRPASRMVLLRGFSRDGFVFYTNYGSRKGAELDVSPQAALLFYWREQARQVRLGGLVEKTSREESLAYFNTRPRGSRLGAWASPQSRPLPDRLSLEMAQKEIGKRFPDEIPLPPYWGGYRLRPDEFEFWQAGADRLHDRFRYLLTGNVWVIERLAP